MMSCCKQPEIGQYTLPDGYHIEGKINIIDVDKNVVHVQWEARIKSTGVTMKDRNIMPIHAWYDIGAIPDRFAKNN